MFDLTPIHVLMAALLARVRPSSQRGQTALEWAVIAGGAVIAALAISGIIYAVARGWGNSVQKAPAQ